MRNRYSLAASAEFLSHMTAEEKKEYNKRYYEEHKDYWREYYGRKIGGSDLTGVARAARDREVDARVRSRLSEEAAKSLAKRERLDPLLKEFNMWTDKVSQWNRERGFGDDMIRRGFVPNKPYVYKNPTTKKFEVDYDTNKYSYLGYKNPLSYGVRNTLHAIKGERGIDEVNEARSRNEAMKKASALSARGVSVMTPAVKKSKVSAIADSAISKGKSIVKNFASLWKLGFR